MYYWWCEMRPGPVSRALHPTPVSSPLFLAVGKLNSACRMAIRAAVHSKVALLLRPTYDVPAAKSESFDAKPSSSEGAISLQKIPALRSHSLLQGFQFVRQPFEFLERTSRELGDRFVITLGANPGKCIVFSQPEDVAAIFQADEQLLDLQPLAEDVFRFLPESAVLLARGDEHKRRKHDFISTMHALSEFDFSSQIAKLVADELSRLKRGRLDRSVDRIFAKLSCFCIYGVELPEREFQEHYRIVTRERLAVSVFANNLIHQFMTGFRKQPIQSNLGFRNILKFVRKRYERGAWAQPSILGWFDRSSKDVDVVAARSTEVFAFLFGALTTSALHGLYAYLKFASARTEIEAAIVDQANQDHSALQRFFQEVLRLYPDVPITFRYAHQETEIGGVQIPAGTIVAPSMYLVHRSAEAFSDAEEFRLSRFDDRSPRTQAYFPGGSGMRACPGISFAVKSLCHVFSEMIRQFEIEPTHPPGSQTRLTVGLQAYRTGRMPATVERRH